MKMMNKWMDGVLCFVHLPCCQFTVYRSVLIHVYPDEEKGKGKAIDVGLGIRRGWDVEKKVVGIVGKEGGGQRERRGGQGWEGWDWDWVVGWQVVYYCV